MADQKISALTSATTPLAGTEVLPIVQSGATVKVATNDLTVRNFRANATTGILQVTGPAAASTRVMTVPDANFTAARIDAAQSFTGDQTLSTGNLVIGTSGKGIDFSATPGTGTSELLADYEEGIWTPAFTFATPGDVAITYGVQIGTYTKVGRMITVAFRITTSAFTWTTASGALQITGIPFASRTLTNMRWHNPCSFNGITKVLYTQFQLQLNSASSTIVANMSGSGQSQSGVSAADVPTGGTPFFSGILTYETD